MLPGCRALVLISINIIVIKCSIPSLNVQKLDENLIARKRQDTLDMCRIFTVENEKLNRAYSKTSYQNGGHRRSKRDTKEPKSFDTIDVENAQRVENIVDKLYEDVLENGEPVKYRHRNIESPTTVANIQSVQNKTMRRFNFAPAELLGPLSTNQTPSKMQFENDRGPPGIDWPKKWKHGIVPYFIDSKTYDAHLSDVITKAFDYFERATCIRLQRLKDRPTDKYSLQNVEWLYITNPSGVKQCVHSNERKTNKGVQMVVFGYDCLSPGEIIHEVMHILGFSHEHTRPDRDQHITILWNNIKPGYKKYFEIRASDTLLNIPYDHASVLHYPPRAFSKNGQVTILTQSGIKLGQREGLSERDVEKVAVIYGNECVERNREYLLKTCPSVVNANTESRKVSQSEVMDYFRDRLWPYGIVNYKLKDAMEFTAEEKENIRAVIRHIEKETCIEFRDIMDEQESDDDDSYSITNHHENAEQYNPSHPLKRPESETAGSDIGTGTNVLSDTTANKKTDTETDNGLKSHSETISKASDTDNGFKSNPESIPKSSDSDNGLKSNPENTPKSSDTDNGLRSDPEGTPQLSDSNNEVKHGDDVDSSINKISSNSENENILRTGTAIPRIDRIQHSRKNGQKPQRRHAADILVFTRSDDLGCECPPPGKPNGNKILKINADCFNSVNDLLHLFVHFLGLDHQHNMYDRDSYLHILWENLTPEIKNEMSEKLPPAASLGFGYDYQSVMHYPWLQIKNGVTNIMYPIWNDGWAMGHWQGLSSTDVLKLNLLYFEKCAERKSMREQ